MYWWLIGVGVLVLFVVAFRGWMYRTRSMGRRRDRY